MKYRKKPMVIDAIQWTGKNISEIFDFVDWVISISDRTKIVTIKTSEGPLIFSAGDWIVRNAEGEFYRLKRDIFDAVYESVENQND